MTLRQEQNVLKGSQLWRLSPILGSDGISRVGGRLEMSNLPYDAKHPVVLPKKHHISKLVVAHIHDQGHHSLGVNDTLAELSMGEKKSSDGNGNAMFVNSKESAEENK